MAANTFDAIVVGAGPSGAAAARRLTAGGMKTLLIEKKKLPRQKMCSGLLSYWTVNFVNRHFGVIPESVYTDVPFLKGVAMHFPSLPQTVYIPCQEPVPYIWRDRFDYFLATSSGANVKDGLQLYDIEAEGNGYKVMCKRFNKDGKASKVTFKAKYVVAADGSSSRARRRMMPNAVSGMPFCTGLQMHYSGKIDISPNYFHGFFYRDVGFYAWANIKDNDIHMGTAAIGHRKCNVYQKNFESLLESKFGLKKDKLLLKEGMSGYMLGLLNKFILGKENFLCTGDAAGFMHNGGEGISCALATGELAGESIVLAEKTGRKAIDFYRENVKPEVDLCLDQANLLRMFKKFPMRLDTKYVMKSNSAKNMILMLKDLRNFKNQDIGMAETGLGKISLNNMFHRTIFGKYPVEL